jgi:hypothetical protein
VIIRSFALPIFLLSMALLTSAGARADRPDDPKDWEFDLALYGWLTDMKGDISAGGVRVDVDPQLWNDIIKNLDGALMGALEARYRNRWIFQLDVFGARISEEIEAGPFQVGFGPRTVQTAGRTLQGSIPLETRFGTIQIPVSRDFAGVRLAIPRVETTLGPVEVDVTTLLVQSRLALGYRLYDAPLLELLGRDADDDPRRVAFDAFVGLRYWYLEAEIDIESPPVRIPSFGVEPSLVRFPLLRLPRVEIPEFSFGGTDREISKSNWWIDPIVGFRVLVDPSRRLRLSLAGNVGGFGIGSASDFAWEASALAFYRISDRVSLGAGYRAQGLDRERSNLDVDLILHGPIVGLVIRL